ncbi:NitT/TauT family transport system ATP-binding protein [Salinibacillus kushneri]|uniref:NitT/TauT family transport system ATP-binding protein n=1 Tax=Salinibacillus kushneri TaxID=237682 RepID=A0A1H9Y5H2_9BACI|nr:ABC transporter ATP-binding protein [Salinibacillus kushneri]SES63630.1 NitT/TauT family transport system ATP-binding protein [Salinibacillus kushneri]
MGYLTVEKVSHLYFTEKNFTKALEDISLDVKKGSFVSIIGPSGCGKTTLLSIIAGLINPTQGNVFLEQKPLERQNSSIGYMLQQDYLFPWKNIMENVLIGPHIQKNITNEIRQKAKELLNEIGIGQTKESYPDQLSGGMRQRVALARTLITDPKLLLLDEPFSALDYQTKLKLENLVLNILKKYQMTSILVTHDIGEAIAMSESIVLLNSNPGRIANVFDVPEEIVELSPFDSRQSPVYSEFFQTVWKELESLE